MAQAAILHSRSVCWASQRAFFCWLSVPRPLLSQRVVQSEPLPVNRPPPPNCKQLVNSDYLDESQRSHRRSGSLFVLMLRIAGRQRAEHELLAQREENGGWAIFKKLSGRQVTARPKITPAHLRILWPSSSTMETCNISAFNDVRRNRMWLHAH